MSNRYVIEMFQAVPNFAGVVNSLQEMEGLPEIKTFFTNYKNPIGIEVEVEGVNDIVSPMKFWGDKDDGSLRNHGREFVSNPLSGRMIDYALWELEAELSRFKKLQWSHRTSIHVHQNFAGMREKQLMAYVMAYGLFEDVLFQMADPYRKANSFCYPATNIDPANFTTIHDHNKYCALNLFPLKRFCTVEWRHMHGTQDFKLIRRWVQLIVKLHAWVDKQDPKTVVDYVTGFIEKEAFVPLFKEIFGASATLFSEQSITESGQKNALWSLCLSTREFN